MYCGGMSEWNYTQCSQPFSSQADAEKYLRDKDFAGYVLKRLDGYTAVCPTYPEGFYPDAVTVSEIDNSRCELRRHGATPAPSCC